MLDSRRAMVNSKRAALGMPLYEFGEKKLRCFSCDLFMVFMKTLVTVKALDAVCKVHRFKHGLCMAAQFLKEDMSLQWNNFREHILGCVCWWEASSEGAISSHPLLDLWSATLFSPASEPDDATTNVCFLNLSVCNAIVIFWIACYSMFWWNSGLGITGNGEASASRATMLWRCRTFGMFGIEGQQTIWIMCRVETVNFQICFVSLCNHLRYKYSIISALIMYNSLISKIYEDLAVHEYKSNINGCGCWSRIGCCFCMFE